MADPPPARDEQRVADGHDAVEATIRQLGDVSPSALVVEPILAHIRSDRPRACRRWQGTLRSHLAFALLFALAPRSQAFADLRGACRYSSDSAMLRSDELSLMSGLRTIGVATQR